MPQIQVPTQQDSQPEVVENTVQQKSFNDKIPANWIITVDSSDEISAVNTNSKEIFKGTIEEFNKLMRG